MTIRPLTARLNELAGTQGLAAQEAANRWAGTNKRSLLEALNVKAGTTGLGLNEVCNRIAGTTGLSAVAALDAAAGGSSAIITEPTQVGTFGTGASNNTATTTFAQTVLSNLEDSMLVVAVAHSGVNGTHTVNTVTYGGVAMTAVPGGAVMGTGATPRAVRLYYLKKPTAGTANVVVTLNNGTSVNTCAIGAVYQDVDQANPFGTPQTASTTGATSLLVNPVADAVTDKIFAACAVRQNFATAASGLTYLSDFNASANTYETIAHKTAVAGANAASFTWSVSNFGALVAVAIHGAPADPVEPEV